MARLTTNAQSGHKFRPDGPSKGADLDDNHCSQVLASSGWLTQVPQDFTSDLLVQSRWQRFNKGEEIWPAAKQQGYWATEDRTDAWEDLSVSNPAAVHIRMLRSAIS